MDLQVSRLRRWFAIGAIVVCAVVAFTYYYSRWRARSVIKEIPRKMNIEVQQSAEGFSVSKSEAGHTFFTLKAKKAVQFKQGGRVELHDVAITLYGRDSSRFDQIYGSEFEYDQPSGDVTAKGEVQIDLEANPEGVAHPDQSIPKELKNPIHLRTSGLVFNQKTGDAHTKEKVEFKIPQAAGTAIGANYTAKDGLLILQSQVQIDFSGDNPATLHAAHGTITKTPRVIVLEQPRLENGEDRSQAEEARLFLRADNTLERVAANGGVQMNSAGASPTQIRAENLEILVTPKGDAVRSATFSRNVQMESTGDQPMQGTAGKLLLSFNGKNTLTGAHTEDNVKLVQHHKASSATSAAQDIELAAPAVDFVLTAKRTLDRATTSGPPQITIRPAGANASGQKTVVTAGKFETRFNAKGQLSSLHGAPDARIVTVTPNQSDRVSTSDVLDADFRPGKGIESIVQQGNFAYVDGDRKAWADRARYTPADQMLFLIGSPRVVDGGMTTTAQNMRMNRVTGDAFADGDVKSTYSDLKAQPNGAMLASSSPIHVTAKSMVAHKAAGDALYSGGARLWQDANVIEAPTLTFDRSQRSVVANGTATQSVSTILIQSDKNGNVTPAKVTSAKMTYLDSERKAHYQGNVVGKWSDMTISATQMDVFMQARGQTTNQAPSGPGKLDRIVANDQVLVTQPNRRANGDQLVYTSVDDKFVLTGGPPSIFDAEQGKITGVSLTLFRHDDRVLIEGNAASPVVTQTRVAR